MKTKNLFRLFTLLVVLSFAIESTFAQVNKTTSGTATTARGSNATTIAATRPEVIDMVSVGSVMPYTVTGDPTLVPLRAVVGFQISEFNWRIDTDPAEATTTLSPAATNHANRVARGADDGLALTAATTADYYLDTAITVQWNTRGVYDVNVSEQSRNTIGLATCSGIDSTLRVWVMPNPSIAFVEGTVTASVDNSLATAGDNTNITGTANDFIVGGCSTDNKNIFFNVVYSGTDRFNGYYTIRYYTLPTMSSGTATTTTADQLIAQQDAGALTWLTANTTTPNEATNTGAFSVNIPASSYGKWVITLTGVTDRIYRKSFTADVTKVGSDAAEADEGSVNVGMVTANTSSIMTIYSLPTPTTGTIRHTTNVGGGLGW